MTEHRTITLPLPEWQPQPELKPEHQRPKERVGYGVTVRTPQVPCPRVECPDTFAKWDQDALAVAWREKSIAEKHIKPHLDPVAKETGTQAILRYLSQRDGGVADIAIGEGHPHSLILSAVNYIRKLGLIRTVTPPNQRPAIYAITPAGKARLERG